MRAARIGHAGGQLARPPETKRGRANSPVAGPGRIESAIDLIETMNYFCPIGVCAASLELRRRAETCLRAWPACKAFTQSLCSLYAASSQNCLHNLTLSWLPKDALAVY